MIMRASTLLTLSVLASVPLIAALSVPSLADQQSEVIKNCKKDPQCHVGSKDKTGGVVITIEGSEPIIYCQPGKLGCDVYHPSSNPKAMRHVQLVLGGRQQSTDAERVFLSQPGPGYTLMSAVGQKRHLARDRFAP